ncbi:hypothetical protein BDW72DRAFT_188514 [Aspergillus terricola var. indicus]
MGWSPSEIFALLALLVAIPTSCIGVWSLLLCLKARNRRAYRQLYPARVSSTPMEELEIATQRDGTTRPPSPHPHISNVLQLPEPQHDLESLTEYQYIMRWVTIRVIQAMPRMPARVP